MFCLTHQERKILLFIGILILGGSFLRLFKVNRQEPFPVEIVWRPQAININIALEKDLETLPGIGEAIAQRIVQYRQQFGPFKSIEDLKEVKGVGEKKLKILKDYIIVE